MRVWVTTATCDDLTEKDCKVINRAVRYLVQRETPTRDLIMRVRMAYKPGLSARDLIDFIEVEETRQQIRRHY